MSGSENPPTVNAIPCARQTNDFDCGMYVILFTEAIVANFVKDELTNNPMAGVGAVTPREASAKRSRLHASLVSATGASQSHVGCIY